MHTTGHIKNFEFIVLFYNKYDGIDVGEIF